MAEKRPISPSPIHHLSVAYDWQREDCIAMVGSPVSRRRRMLQIQRSRMGQVVLPERAEFRQKTWRVVAGIPRTRKSGRWFDADLKGR